MYMQLILEEGDLYFIKILNIAYDRKIELASYYTFIKFVISVQGVKIRHDLYCYHGMASKSSHKILLTGAK